MSVAPPNAADPVGRRLAEMVAELRAAGDAGGISGAYGEVDPGVAEQLRLIRVIDVGGGSGTRAVPLAMRGCHVTVVDSSIDALAILRRRAVDAGVQDRIESVQADADRLATVAAPGSADLVLCHHVLQEFSDPAEVEAVLSGIATVLRPGGLVSILVAGRLAAVLAHALAGRYQQAATILSDPDGRFGTIDPLRRRFEADELSALLQGAGLTVESVQGSRVITDLLPGSVRLEQDAEELIDLAALERFLSAHQVMNRLGTDLHAIARAPVPAGG